MSVGAATGVKFTSLKKGDIIPQNTDLTFDLDTDGYANILLSDENSTCIKSLFRTDTYNTGNHLYEVVDVLSGLDYATLWKNGIVNSSEKYYMLPTSPMTTEGNVISYNGYIFYNGAFTLFPCTSNPGSDSCYCNATATIDGVEFKQGPLMESSLIKTTFMAVVREYTGVLDEITPDKTIVDFGTMEKGGTLPAAQTITLKNTGVSEQTIVLPQSTNFDISAVTGFAGDMAMLKRNETASFTITPKAGLDISTCSEEIKVETMAANHLATITAKVAVTEPATAAPTAPSNNNPATGDNITGLAFYAIASLASAMGVVVLKKKIK